MEWSRVKWENRLFKGLHFNEKRAFDKIFKKFAETDDKAKTICSDYNVMLKKDKVESYNFTEIMKIKGSTVLSIGMSANSEITIKPND